MVDHELRVDERGLRRENGDEVVKEKGEMDIG